MRKGFAYANVHTATYGGGEIRGQIKARHKGRGDDGDKRRGGDD